jgi:5-methylcytosine-specific restriction protein B
MADALTELSKLIAGGLPAPEGGARPRLEALFGNRYYQRFSNQVSIRDPLSPKLDVPFAGFIHPDNPTSGAYGGASLIWFPTENSGSMITFVVGTAGLSPDEGLLSRPGHRRRVQALRRYLANQGVWTWTKPDPTALGVPVPHFVSRRLPDFKKSLERYGNELYAIAEVPRNNPERARFVTQAFFDLYAFERGWPILKDFEAEYHELIDALRADLFTRIEEDEIYRLLQDRRFVILQGPPGTGKTRMADRIKRHFFNNHGMTVQFHPAVTYEDFIVGLSPDTSDRSLYFTVRPGWLLEAARASREKPFLLVIDEINRADLGKVLGETIYLFEPGEEIPRTVQLPHVVNGETSFSLPPNLYVLGTMNTADRSIAPIDLAIRRRFAFVTLSPDSDVISENSVITAVKVFGALQDVFTEHAPDEVLNLLPGQSFFLAETEDELRQRFRFELLPLLDEYLREGLVASFGAELQAVRDQIEGLVDHGVWVE